MRPALIDTDILSLFLRGDPNVGRRFAAYLMEHGKVSISLITYYEILSGLKFRDARRQLTSFLDLARRSNVYALSQKSCVLSADIYKDLRGRGCLIDDADILIAGVAQAHGLVLATRNQHHFGRISTLQLEDWSTPE